MLKGVSRSWLNSWPGMMKRGMDIATASSHAYEWLRLILSHPDFSQRPKRLSHKHNTNKTAPDGGMLNLKGGGILIGRRSGDYLLGTPSSKPAPAVINEDWGIPEAGGERLVRIYIDEDIRKYNGDINEEILYDRTFVDSAEDFEAEMLMNTMDDLGLFDLKSTWVAEKSDKSEK